MTTTFDILAKKAITKGNWTREQLQALSPSYLKMISTSNGKATPQFPAELRALIEKQPLTDADTTLAYKIRQSASLKIETITRPDAYTNSFGGRITYAPKTVMWHPLNGEYTERSNSPIPVNFNQVEKYENVVALTALLSQLVTVQAGSWVSTVNVKSWAKLFDGSIVDISNVTSVANTVVDILNNDSVWTGSMATFKNSCSGANGLVFIRSAFDRLEEDTYYLLNTMVVCDFFRTFLRQEGKYYANKENGKNVVDSKIYKVLNTSTLSAKLISIIKSRPYPGVFLYLGGVYPQPNVPTGEDLESAIKAGQTLREIQGSDDSSMSILSGMRGYSGLTDNFGKRIQFILAATLFAWSKNRQVDVKLTTVGDAPMILSSLNSLRRRITESQAQYFVTTINEKTVVAECDFKFILPSDTDQVPEQIRSVVTNNVRPNSVVVFSSDYSLPTSEKKGLAVNYDAKSFSVLPVSIQQNDYIVNCVIFGPAFFWSEPEVKKEALRLNQSLVPWKKPAHVYKFSTAAFFRGIASSFADLVLFGSEITFMPEAKTVNIVHAEKFVLVKVDKIQNHRQWYKNVCSDVAAQSAVIFGPKSRYSPISNLVHMSKAAVMLQRQVVDFQGELIGNIRIVKQQEVGPEINFFSNNESDRQSGPSVDEISFLEQQPFDDHDGMTNDNSNDADNHSNEQVPPMTNKQRRLQKRQKKLDLEREEEKDVDLAKVSSDDI